MPASLPVVTAVMHAEQVLPARQAAVYQAGSICWCAQQAAAYECLRPSTGQSRGPRVSDDSHEVGEARRQIRSPGGEERWGGTILLLRQ